MLSDFTHLLRNYLVDQGMDFGWATYINLFVVLLILAVLLFGIDWLIRKGIVRIFKLFADKTTSTFDDFLIESNFPRYVAHFLPLLVTRYVISQLLDDFPAVLRHILTAIDVYAIILGALVCRSVFKSIRNFLFTKRIFKDKPLDSYVQVLMIFVWIFAVLFIIYRATGYSIPSLATFGAASALLLLIFKDTILGFIASIQITVNDIVRLGDWITVEKFGADGIVTQINLATVRVQNFDKTYTTVPTYSLISDSFQNWRGMQEAAGRRIKRSLYIKQNSVAFLTQEKIEQLKEISLISGYLTDMQQKLLKINADNQINDHVAINGKRLTNLGVYRKYIDAYLNSLSAINKEEFLMVRHLQPTAKGIPIQVYCFSHDKKWENYEYIQADIFDHLIAAVSYFDLEIYEYPSGQDLNTQN